MTRTGGWRLPAAYALQLPGLGVVAVALGLATFDGGYAGSAWYPVAVLLLALLVVAWLSVGRLWSVPRPVAVGLGAFAAFCLWSYASVLWADAPGAALEGANRALLYLVTLTVVAVVPWPARAARAAVVLVVVGVSAIAIGTLARLPTGGGSLEGFFDGRLQAPLGYVNATASFWCMAFWPALALATGPARSRIARTLRPAALGSAGLLTQMALLGQSRGAVLALGVTTVLFVVLTPHRGPALLALLAVAATTALAWGTLLDVRAAAAPELGDALADARRVIVVSALALLLAAAVFDRLIELLPRISTQLGAPRVGNRAGGLLAAALAVVALVAVGNHSSQQIDATGSRFTGSLGSGRSDYWRVALIEFRAHPLNGVGADNFHADYLRERRTDEAPRHPHSLAMRLVSQVGIVGTAAFLVFLGALLAATRRARRHADRLVSAGLLSACAIWFVQAQIDWLWAFPALGMLTFAMLGIAARLRCDDEPQHPQPAAGVDAGGPYAARPVALTVAVVTLTLAVAAAFGALGAASRAERHATDRAATEPRAAIADFEQAARLNPLAAEPLVTEAVLARRLGDRALARRSLERALAREPDNWFAHFELALLDAISNRREAALRRLMHVRKLNPRQPVVGETLHGVRRGAAINPDALERELDRQRTARLQPVGGR